MNETPVEPLTDKRVLIVGKTGGMSRRDLSMIIRQRGGQLVETRSPDIDIVVIGADEFPLVDEDELLGPELRDAAAAGSIRVLSETQLWEELGLVDDEHHVRRLYTPAMLADLLDVSLGTIRRWHRRGLIVPVREVHRLPYFDFREVATAQRLAQLVAAGASPSAIERKLAELSRLFPEVDRPLAQLSVIIEGKQLLLRQGEGLIEPGGQLRIDFDGLGSVRAEDDEDGSRAIVSIFDCDTPEAGVSTPDELISAAIALEDEGDLDAAIESYRAAMMAGGSRAELCFRLAELLYRRGELLAARERYYMAIELDEEFIEARASLGCVMVELGELELAVAAFRGALTWHDDYPDVHYHLARTLDELAQGEEAEKHWAAFLELASDSPWAAEAHERLSGG